MSEIYDVYSQWHNLLQQVIVEVPNSKTDAQQNNGAQTIEWIHSQLQQL